MPVEIRAMESADADAVLDIFREGMEDRIATFETQCPDWERFDGSHLPDGRLVAHISGQIVGWAVLAPVSSRACYRGVAEVSIYIKRPWRQQGIGSLLMAALITCSESLGYWTLQSSTFEENRASLILQERHGFRRVGIRERIGCLDGRWRNTVLMERRSPMICPPLQGKEPVQIIPEGHHNDQVT